jgi:hypothetical protein
LFENAQLAGNPKQVKCSTMWKLKGMVNLRNVGMFFLSLKLSHGGLMVPGHISHFVTRTYLA